jgi:peroxiredoxin
MNGVSFPQVTARDLGGREVALPADLRGQRNVVLIAFRRDQQQLVDSWMP